MLVNPYFFPYLETFLQQFVQFGILGIIRILGDFLRSFGMIHWEMSLDIGPGRFERGAVEALKRKPHKVMDKEMRAQGIDTI